MIELSPDQKLALDQLTQWWSKRSGYITLGGYAGTGKTTLISYFKAELDREKVAPKVAFVSYTGKATRVLKDTLQKNSSLKGKDYIGTIHSLIYSPVVSISEEIVGWQKKEELEYDLIIVDEASMVDGKIWEDLKSFDIPILAVGDHGQLPPINGSFNLMDNPQIKLERIHRQAQNNPIIKIASFARIKGLIPVGKFSDQVKKLDKTLQETGEEVNDLLMSFNPDTLVLCGYNTTRVKLNQHIRASLGFEDPDPTVGDRVICLRNNHEKKIFNGMLGRILYIEAEDEEWSFAEIQFDSENIPYKGLISMKQFNSSDGALNFTSKRKETLKGDLFDFGYATTVHKAQGSQAPKVILFEERFKQMDDQMWKRWLYTAVTRAESELTVIG